MTVSKCLPDQGAVLSPAMSGRIISSSDWFTPASSIGVFRLPTDPLFYADLTLLNIMGGSRYRVTRASNGAELATGVVSGSVLTDVTLFGLAVYANPMLVNITVRNASGATKYKVFDTAASMVRGGASAYILQQED